MTRAYMSFGAGVQSTAIAMLAINRDERLLKVTGSLVPELYIFADTGDEPKALYPHVADMKARIEASGAKFLTVSAANAPLAKYVIERTKAGLRTEQLPLFVATEAGGMAPLIRGCTGHFKIEPIRRASNQHFHVWRGKTPRDLGRVFMWLGLSHDEPQRLKSGPVANQKWATYACPLYDMRWTRGDCVNYLASQGVVARRSACVYCPFHSVDEWRAIKAEPEDWAKALELDKTIERTFEKHKCIGHNRAPGSRIVHEPFLTQQGVRLRHLDTSVKDDPQRQLFDNECAGVCGV